MDRSAVAKRGWVAAIITGAAMAGFVFFVGYVAGFVRGASETRAILAPPLIRIEP